MPVQLGEPPMTDSQDPWYAGAAGWTQLSKAFLQLELVKPDPDYRSLAEQIAAYPAEERHAVWVEVAQSASSRAARTRSYLEALHNDPDPASVAWGWLDGDFDLMDKVEHVIDPADARTLATVEELRERLGSIIEAGGRDLPVATEIAAPEQPAPTQAQAQPAAQSLAAPTWSPTHFVPMGGLPAWDYPDPNRQPSAVLNARLGLVVEAVAGDWALVRAVNGWRGWVDGPVNRRPST